MIWRKLVASAAAAVVMTAGAAYAAVPRSMELSAETTVVNGKDKLIFNSITRVKGAKMRVETFGTTKGPDGQPMNSVMIIDPSTKAMYMLNDKTHSAMKVKLDQASAQMNLGAGITPDPTQISAEMKKRGGKIVGHETMLGRATDIWEVPYQSPTKEKSTAKVWLANDISMPLKIEVSTQGKGNVMSLRVTKVHTDIAIPDSVFSVPSGYKVTDMQDLAKRMQQMQKGQHPAVK